MTIGQVSGPAVEIVRRKIHLRRAPEDHWVLSFCRRGESTIDTRNGTIRAPAGTPYFWSLGEETVGERTAVDGIQLYLPRDSFPDIAPLFDSAIDSVVDTPLGIVLGEFMLSLERNLRNLSAADLPRVEEAIGALIAACIAPSAGRLREAQGSIDFCRMERVRQAVRTHLRTPAISPESLCRMVAVSRSQLYRILEGWGGVARYIQRQRLLEAHRLLYDTTLNQPIFAIAEDLCFDDASSFRRAFRREFGLNPNAIRAAVLVPRIILG